MDDALDRNWCPRLRPDVQIEAVDGEMVALDVEAERIHQLNLTASFILGLCDGKRSVGTILELLLAEFDVPEELAARDLGTILTRMKSLGLLT